VAEGDRIRFTKMLVAMREDENCNRIEMPPDLTNTERKFIHQLAIQLGLKSKSSGKGDARRIAITKVSERKKIAGQSLGDDDYLEAGDLALPSLNVGRKGAAALRRHILTHPPSAVEEAESRLTGSSITNVMLGIGGDAEEAEGDDEAGDGIVLGGGANVAEAGLLHALDELDLKGGDSRSKRKVAHTRTVDITRRAQRHERAQKAKKSHRDYGRMLKQRKVLPAYSFASHICDAIGTHRVTVLSGDTGCGKSTQVPQFLLDDTRIGPTASIVITQPRRISAISVAERVASERCEDVGSTVGYNVRLEGATSADTQLLFVTPGVLLRRLQSSPDLNDFTIVIMDEVHERDKYTEFLMIALRDLMLRRDDLRLVLMSATIQTNELVTYWSGVGTEEWADIGGAVPPSLMPAEVSIPGRTFPVQEFFLEEVLSMTGFVDDDGLMFSPDMDRIETELMSLVTNQQPGILQQQKGGVSRGGNKRAGTQEGAVSVSQGDKSVLTCVMCGVSGFGLPEELGEHVALCNGGGNVTMLELEDKVRGIDLTFIVGHDYSGEAVAKEEPSEEDAILPEYDSYDDEEEPGLRQGKWDGESPFGIADVVASNNLTTLTEEEMLNRYQSMHDDERVDDALLLETVKYIIQSSYGPEAILIFFPGWAEISEFTLLLESTEPFNDRTKCSILPLHSGIPSKEQRRVFVRPPEGVRKIILATNIAETSITIDDVAFVVDTGRAKEKSYDPHLKTSTLQPVWVSQASAKQRMGRAGRTKPGVCFHLFSRRRHSSFRPFLESELLRTPLEEMCLQCKKLDLAPGGPDDVDGIPAFLSKALTPPHPKSIANAIELLVELGAMDSETNDLTNLGQCLSALSLEPRVGKMVVWSHLLGCARAASSMGVAMSYKSPFVLPPSSMRKAADNERIELSKHTESDQITILNILNIRDSFARKGRQNAFYGFCRDKFLGPTTIQMIADLRRNVSRELLSLSFPDPNNSGYHNRSGESDPAFLQAAIAAGLYPNVASRKRGESNFSTVTNRKAKVHISSVNSCKGQPLNNKCQVQEGEIEFIIFGEMVRGVASFTMSQTTHLVSPLPLILLCGELRVRPAHVEATSDRKKQSVLSVDDWILFICDEDTAAGLVVLRRRLNGAFGHLVASPHAGLSKLSMVEKDVVETLGVVLRSGHNVAPKR